MVLSLPKLIGINFHGYSSSAYQNRYTPLPPQNYIGDSFKIFADNRITCIRVTFYWESWELDRNQFHEDLKAIGEVAEKHGLMCIYDNHQWECSSWIGSGIGFPNSIMAKYFQKTTTGDKPKYDTKKHFWNKWWNRQIKTADEVDGWNAQLTYLVDVVRLLNHRKSTYGFEILNEPQVFATSYYQKIGKYYDYMINGIRKVTNKPLFFCRASPHRIIDNPVLQELASPRRKDNVIYDCHPYPPYTFYMLYYKLITLLMGKIPLYIGEFNSTLTKNVGFTERQMSQYLKRFKRFRTCGWALWRWSYIPDRNIQAFNMTEIRDNRICPGKYFKFFVNALKTTKY